MAAQLEEVVVDAQRLDAEQLFPERVQASFNLVARGRIRGLGPDRLLRWRDPVAVGRRYFGRRSFDRCLLARGMRLCLGLRLNPKSLALERVSRQREQAAAAPGVIALRLDGDARQPEPSDRA